MQMRWQLTAIPVVLTVFLSGCGTSNNTSIAKSNTAPMANANSAHAVSGTGNMSNSSMSNSSMSNTASSTHFVNGSVGTPLGTKDLLIGATASPMMGKGPGGFIFDNVGKGKVMTAPLARGANAFQIAISGNTAYVPTLQGQTYMVNIKMHSLSGHFATPKAARIANIADKGKLLLITGAHSVTAYELPNKTVKWTLHTGGNTLAIAGNGNAYLSANNMNNTLVINLASGKQVASIPVGHIEDSVYDSQTHTLWLANWNTGRMTVVNADTNHVIKTIKRAEGGGFDMKNMMQSKGGFMQLAVGPNGDNVYAASFSGNIMVYNAQKNAFQKDIHVGSMAKLSGLAVDPSDKYIYTTVENKHETVAVSLQSDKVVSTMPGVLSNRWTVVNG